MTTRNFTQSIQITAAGTTIDIPPPPPVVDSRTASSNFLQSIQITAATPAVDVPLPQANVTMDFLQSIQITTGEIQDITVTPQPAIPDPPAAAAAPVFFDRPVIHVGRPNTEGISRNGDTLTFALADNIPAFFGKSVRIWIDRSEFSDLDDVVVSLVNPNGADSPLLTMKKPDANGHYGYLTSGGSDWYPPNLDSFLVEGTQDPANPITDSDNSGARIKVTALDELGRPLPPGIPNLQYHNPREFIGPSHSQALVAEVSERARRARKLAFYDQTNAEPPLRVKTWYMGLLEPLRTSWLPGPPLRPRDSDPLVIQNGRDSAISLSPPHIPSFSCSVVDDDQAFYNAHDDAQGLPAELTHSEVRVIEESHFRNRALFTGVLMNPKYILDNRQRYMQLRGNGMASLMAATNLVNLPELYTPGVHGGSSGITTRNAIWNVARKYAETYGHLSARDIIESISAQSFYTRLPYWWVNWENPWSVFGRIVQTEGPPANFYENEYGRLVFFNRTVSGVLNRADPVRIGGGTPETELQTAGPITIDDHISDIVNDASVTVQLKGFILPGNLERQTDGSLVTASAGVLGSGYGASATAQDAGTAVSQRALVDGVGVGQELIYENFREQFWYQTVSGGLQVGPMESFTYRIDSDAPIVNPQVVQTEQDNIGGSVAAPRWAITTTRLNASTFEVAFRNRGGTPAYVPAFLFLGTKLKTLGATEYWADHTVRTAPETLASIDKHRYRLYSYGGYSSIYGSVARDLANRVVKYYRDGIKTVGCTVFVPDNVTLQEEAGKLRPLQPVQFTHPRGNATWNMLVRSVSHRYIDHRHFIDLVLDENIDSRLA